MKKNKKRKKQNNNILNKTNNKNSNNNKENNNKEAEGKHAGGRPKAYTDVEIMQQKIDSYFDSCFEPKRDKEGKILRDFDGSAIMVQTKPFTLSGLALALDIDRRTLLNYSKDDKFFPTIKKARNKIEAFLEEQLITNGGTGVIFNLKNNYGWKDKQENVNLNTSYEDYLKRVEGNEY